MPRHQVKTSLKQISEINLTPLMDLTFILLITFIITFPLIEQGIPIDLPEGNATPVEAQTAQTVSIDREGQLFLDESPVTLEQLTTTMKAVALSDPMTVVMVRADQAIAYGRVAEILKVLHGANITRLSLVTRAEEGG